MSSQAMHAFERADAHVDARQITIERQLRRFRPKVRDAVRAVASRHVRLAELSVSFPALLVALAWPRAGVDVRPIVSAVISGAPLASLAKFAGVPMWLRRMAPEMLVAPVPVLPDSPFIRHRIVNHFPRHPKHAEQWFEAVSSGARWGHESFALWCAANFNGPIRSRYRKRYCSVDLLSLWAWFSLQPDTLGYWAMKTRWTVDIQHKAAVMAALAWRDALDLLLHVNTCVAGGRWHSPAVVDGYAFVPLCDFADIRNEAEAMQNCLLGYGESVAMGAAQVWSVRKDGVRVATLEMARVGRNPVPVLQQLCGVRNENVPRELWLTAHKWLREQETHMFCDGEIDWGAAAPSRSVWQALWKPYWLAKKETPAWLPLVPGRYTLGDL